MAEFTIYSFGLNLFYCVVAVAVLLLLLRLFDRMLGIRFSEVWHEIKSDNNIALALYHGLRFVGCCILLGCIIS